MSRRPDGSLEHDIMKILWAAERALLPAEVNEQLDQPLAYTTVATVLTRLHAKGLVRRSNAGRAYEYAAAVPESELAVRRMAEVLITSGDRKAVLAGLVRTLSKRDAKVLRQLLEDDRS